MRDAGDIVSVASIVERRQNEGGRPLHKVVGTGEKRKSAETLARVDDCLAGGSGDGTRVDQVTIQAFNDTTQIAISPGAKNIHCFIEKLHLVNW